VARDYQIEALDRLEGNSIFALLMAMRTGKTKVALDDFGRLEKRGECRTLLVIAPAGVYRTWEGQIKDHVSDDLQSRLEVFTWESGMGKEKKLHLAGFLKLKAPRIFLVNVEALSLDSTGARKACVEFLEPSSMIVIDESTIIKSSTAKRTKFIIQKLKPLAKYRRILSGLPTPRSPLDLYSQFEFLDGNILGHSTFASFQAEYAIMVKKLFYNARWPTWVVVGYRNTEKLAELIEPYSFRVPFRPDIPPTYSIREVAMTERQKTLYEQMKQMATAQLSDESHVTAVQVVTQMLRLHQILCGHVVDENGKEVAIPENKTKELVELLEDYDGKAIIWVSYDADVTNVVKALKAEYGEGSVARFWGGNYATREDEERQFKTDPSCRFMVATASAGGRGRTWDVANLVIYYSSLNNLEHRDQSEQRAQNVGKNTGVDYVDLICPGTVESKILTALRAKIDLAATITGDEWRDWIV